MSALFSRFKLKDVTLRNRIAIPPMCQYSATDGLSNDWHAVHFFRPRTVSANSPMPDYPWFFYGASNKPTRRGLSIITYVQWLGSWLDSYPYYEELAELEAEE